jgi:hypothetical protein
MRVAQSRINLGIVAARRGDLDQAVFYGHSAFAYERRSVIALTSSAANLDAILQQHYQGEHLARDFHERHLHIRQALEARKSPRSETEFSYGPRICTAESSRSGDQGGACGTAGPASAPGSAFPEPPGARRAACLQDTQM